MKQIFATDDGVRLLADHQFTSLSALPGVTMSYCDYSAQFPGGRPAGAVSDGRNAYLSMELNAASTATMHSSRPSSPITSAPTLTTMTTANANARWSQDEAHPSQESGLFVEEKPIASRAITHRTRVRLSEVRTGRHDRQKHSCE